MCILCNLRKNMEDVSHQCWQNETDRFHFKYVILWTVQPLIITVLLTEFLYYCIVLLLVYSTLSHLKWVQVSSCKNRQNSSAILWTAGSVAIRANRVSKTFWSSRLPFYLRVSAEGQSWQPVGEGSTNSCSRWGYYETSSSRMNVSKPNRLCFHRSTL